MKKRRYAIEEVERLYRKAIYINKELSAPGLHPEEREFILQRSEYYLGQAWRLLCSLNVKSKRGQYLMEDIGWDVHTIEGIGY